jgi:hypothetical protein
MATTRTLSSMIALSLFAGLTACEDGDALSASADEIAMDAAIRSAQEEYSDQLPATETEIAELANDFVEAAAVEVECTRTGIASGIWYDEDLAPRFEGSWFERGTGKLGGTIDGPYDNGEFEGTVYGDVDGELLGTYSSGHFEGDWVTTNGHSGELRGQYERRNELGGYFFGVWTECP